MGEIFDRYLGGYEEQVMVYTPGFKARMVQRMCGPEGISANALAKEIGTAQPTLSRWKKDARILAGMTDNERDTPRRKSNRQRSADDILRIVTEVSQLADDELGAYLRKHGLHTAQIEEWRALLVSALSAPKTSKKKSPGIQTDQGA